MMAQTGAAAQIFYEHLSQLGGFLLSDAGTGQFLSSPDSDPAFEYNLYHRLKGVREGYPFVHSILLYHRANVKMLSDYFGNILLEDRLFLEQLDSGIRSRSSFVKLSLPGFSSTHPQRERVLGFLFYPFSRTGEEPDRSIVVLVREEYLRDLISSISMNPLKEVVLLDGSGNIVLTSGTKELPKELRFSDIAKNSGSRSETGESFVQKIDRQAYRVFSTRIEDLDWILCSVSDQDSGLEPLRQALFSLGLVSVPLLVFGAVTTVFVTRRMYAPVSSLMKQAADTLSFLPKKPKQPAPGNEYELISRSLKFLSEYSFELETKAEKTAPLLHEAVVRKILNQSYSERDMEEICKLEAYSLPCHRVLLISLDQMYLFAKSAGKASRDILVYAIQNMLGEVLKGPADGILFAPNRQTGELIVLLSAKKSIPSDTVVSAVGRIQRVFNENFSCSFSAAVGEQTGFSMVHASWEDARRLLRYRFVCGSQSMLIMGMVSRREEKPLENDMIKKNVESLLARMSPDAALFAVKTFLYQFHEAFYAGYSDLFQDPSVQGLLTEPERLETLSSIQTVFLELIEKIQMRRI